MRFLSRFTINTASFIIQLILTPSSKGFTLVFCGSSQVGKMKTVLLVVLLAAAATAAVFNNDVPDLEQPSWPDLEVVPEAPDVDVNEAPEVFVADLLELPDRTDAAEETAIDTRRNLAVGTISGTRIYNTQHRANGISGYQIVRDITVRTSKRITAIRVTRIGASQNATPSIMSGGVGNSFVTIRIRSATGRGFNYRVEIYAR